jgi:hypothetical protein
MFELLATASGTTDSLLVNLLLDVSADVARSVWLAADLLLTCRAALVSANDAPARGG